MRDFFLGELYSPVSVSLRKLSIALEALIRLLKEHSAGMKLGAEQVSTQNCWANVLFRARIVECLWSGGAQDFSRHFHRGQSIPPKKKKS